MILILADTADRGAIWLKRGLQDAVSMPIVAISPTRLVYAPSIVQRLSTASGHAQVVLGDGMRLDFGAVKAVINRVTALPTAHLEHAEPAERLYAATELNAFMLGWLAAFEGPMLNPPSPEWLAGPLHSEVEALQIAWSAGLLCPLRALDAVSAPTRAAEPAGDMIHFLLDDRVIGPALPQRWHDALVQFGHGWGARMLQVETRAHADGRAFVAASSFVDFARGGAALIRALARALDP